MTAAVCQTSSKVVPRRSWKVGGHLSFQRKSGMLGLFAPLGNWLSPFRRAEKGIPATWWRTGISNVELCDDGVCVWAETSLLFTFNDEKSLNLEAKIGTKSKIKFNYDRPRIAAKNLVKSPNNHFNQNLLAFVQYCPQTDTTGFCVPERAPHLDLSQSSRVSSTSCHGKWSKADDDLDWTVSGKTIPEHVFYWSEVSKMSLSNIYQKKIAPFFFFYLGFNF